MSQKLSRILLKIMGWKATMNITPPDKCLICVAPHTSNWDFVFGKLGYLAVGRTANFLIKKEWLDSPLGFFFKAIGGIGVDRKRHSSLISGMTEMFNTLPQIHLAITPEGTRKRNPNWKKGIYHIAISAKVPIILAYIDYKKKEVGFAETFHPTGDEQKDWFYIKSFYNNITAKYPKRFATGV